MCGLWEAGLEKEGPPRKPNTYSNMLLLCKVARNAANGSIRLARTKTAPRNSPNGTVFFILLTISKE